MKIPMPKDTLLSVTISPDTLKTLEKGTFYGNQMAIAKFWRWLCFINRC